MTTELQAHYRIHSCRPPKGRRRRGLAGVFWLLLGGAAALSFPADQPRAMTAVFGRMLHVAPSGADGNDGASWASPLLTIARAVEAAGVGDTIAVSNGTYEITAQIRVSKGVIIRGIGRSPDDVVIKRKSNNVRIFELDHVNARIENLTVSGGIITGTSGKGGNILIASGGGAVVGCIIRDGVVTSGVGVIGAGVHVASDAGLVSGCLITNNYTKDYNSDGGAGLSMEKGRVVNCIIADNAQHVTTVNTTKPTGAVRMTGGELIHCTITRNQMYGGTAGVYATGGRVVNCIIAGNFALLNTAAASVYAGNAACFENCVSDTVLINSSCFQEEVDFADPYVSDWRLQAGSVCIDNGVGVEALPDVDVAGNPRIRGTAPDIGAVERQADAGLDAGFAYTQRKPYGAGEVDFTAAVSGAAGSVNYTWNFGDGSEPVSGGSGAVSHAYGEPGVFLVTLAASDGGTTVSAVRTVYVRGDVIRVVNTGNPNAVRPYATWGTACGSIEEALAFADDGATVLLTNGIHKVLPPCQINKPVTLRGVSGVPGDVLIQRDTSASCTTFYLNHEGVVLSGLTVENGYNNAHRFGGGVLINDRGGTVTNCIVRNCTVMAGGAGGGGIFLRGPGLVTHCVITGNKADDNGSKGGCGIAMEAAGRIENCLIAGNVTTLALGIAGREDQKAAGGVYMTDGSLVNCTIVDNRSLNVGGVYLTGGAVTNCIISGNTSEGTKGGATARVYDGDAARFVNCASADLLINATCVFGDMAFAPGFTLSPASAALDAGIVPVGGLAPLDLAGNQRISANGLVDAGCYELQDGPLSVAFIVADGEGIAPFNATFTARTRNETGAVTFTWDFGDGADPCVTAAAETSHTYAVPGDYTVTVTACDGAATADAARTGLIAVRPRTLYVSDGNPNASVPYDSWDCAAAKVETACAYAVGGCTVLVAPGSYRLASEVVLTRGIALIGITGNPGEVVIGRGTSNIRPFTLNHEGALLSAITVENGYNTSSTIGGGNVLIASGGGTVSNCILRNAMQIGAGRTSAGSGLYVGSPKGLATHCVITNNTCNDQNSAGGAGVFMSAGRVENCLIAFNSQNNANPNNLTAKGGARVDGGMLVNCTVVSNALYSVGGIYSDGGAVVNCVIARNRSKTTATEAANVNGDYNSPLFVNCATEAFDLNDTCVIGPMHFAGSETGNFRLLPGSVAIDAGAMDVGGILFGTDLDGKPRVEHGIIDIGCYETTWLPPATMLLIR